jgi:hypothetical protein
MTATHVIEFSISDFTNEAENRYDVLVDTIVEQFVPAVGLTTGTCPDELAARLMIELAYQVGATHSSQSILSLLAAVADAARAGQEASEGSNEQSEDPDQMLFDLECSPSKH